MSSIGNSKRPRLRVSDHACEPLPPCSDEAESKSATQSPRHSPQASQARCSLPPRPFLAITRADSIMRPCSDTIIAALQTKKASPQLAQHNRQTSSQTAYRETSSSSSLRRVCIFICSSDAALRNSAARPPPTVPSAMTAFEGIEGPPPP